METFVVINATTEERNPTFYNHFFSCTRLGKSHIDACPTSDKCYHFSSEYTICYHHLKPHGAPCKQLFYIEHRSMPFQISNFAIKRVLQVQVVIKRNYILKS